MALGNLISGGRWNRPARSTVAAVARRRAGIRDRSRWPHRLREPMFERLTGYGGRGPQTPRILRSGKHSRAFYEDYWRTIIRARLAGTIVNRRRMAVSTLRSIALHRCATSARSPVSPASARTSANASGHGGAATLTGWWGDRRR